MNRITLLSLLLCGCAAIPPPTPPLEPTRYHAEQICAEGNIIGMWVGMTGPGVLHLEIPADVCERIEKGI